jgi:hypothetical protein
MAMPICFDATITIGHHHLRAAGLDAEQAAVAAVNAVRRAVERMDGANWIDVMASDYPPATPSLRGLDVFQAADGEICSD